MSVTSGRKYGWKKDDHDPSIPVHTFKLSRFHASVPIVDLRPFCPPIYDQGDLGSCTANAIAAAYEFDVMKEKEVHPFTPSRLFIYYNERVIENSVSEDSGAQLKDGIKSICTTGVCPETMWPYNPIKFTVKPPKECFKEATKHKAVQYKKLLPTLPQLFQALINGFPFVCGIMVYESFEAPSVAATGMISVPKHGEQLLGGHAICIVGKDDTKQAFILRNSWGTSWPNPQMAGYCYIPYNYLTDHNLAADFWVVTDVKDL